MKKVVEITKEWRPGWGNYIVYFDEYELQEDDNIVNRKKTKYYFADIVVMEEIPCQSTKT